MMQLLFDPAPKTNLPPIFIHVIPFHKCLVIIMMSVSCVVMSRSPEHFPQEGMVYLNFDREAVL